MTKRGEHNHEPIDVEGCLDYVLLSISGYDEDEDVATQPALNRLAAAAGMTLKSEFPVMPGGPCQGNHSRGPAQHQFGRAMSDRKHDPLRRGSKREGIIEPDAPPVFHSGPVVIGFEQEADPRPTDESDEGETSGPGWPD